MASLDKIINFIASVPAIWCMCGPPCSPGNTASLIGVSRLYIISEPSLPADRTPEQYSKQYCVLLSLFQALNSARVDLTGQYRLVSTITGCLK